MTIRTCTKVNIGLNVLRKRPDGYHDLETLFRQAGPSSPTSNPRCSAAAPRGTGGVPPDTPLLSDPSVMLSEVEASDPKPL